MRTQNELDEALLLLAEVNTPEAKAQWEVIEGKHTESWVFDKYVRDVHDDEKNESLFYAARDAAQFVSGKIDLEMLFTGAEFEETEIKSEVPVPQGFLGMLLQRIERLEKQVRILKGMKQKRSYRGASDYEDNDFMTQTEAYKYIGCAQCTVIKWTNKGMLKAYRKGNHLYYKKSELDMNPGVLNFRNIKHN